MLPARFDTRAGSSERVQTAAAQRLSRRGVLVTPGAHGVRSPLVAAVVQPPEPVSDAYEHALAAERLRSARVLGLLRFVGITIASALNLLVHIERMRDGVRRVQGIAEIAGMEGEIITMRELFTYDFRGERRDGRIEGEFRSTRMRPDFLSRAARIGLDRELLELVGVAGGAA